MINYCKQLSSVSSSCMKYYEQTAGTAGS